MFGESADQLIAEALERSAFPKPATVSRLQMRMDASFMLHMRDLHAQLLAHETVFYEKTDSSP
eukprot:12267808-Alexandrium_andersonii.AAC.1